MGYVENYVMTDVNNPPLKIDPHFFYQIPQIAGS